MGNGPLPTVNRQTYMTENIRVVIIRTWYFIQLPDLRTVKRWGVGLLTEIFKDTDGVWNIPICLFGKHLGSKLRLKIAWPGSIGVPLIFQSTSNFKNIYRNSIWIIPLNIGLLSFIRIFHKNENIFCRNNAYLVSRVWQCSVSKPNLGKWVMLQWRHDFKAPHTVIFRSVLIFFVRFHIDIFKIKIWTHISVTNNANQVNLTHISPTKNPTILLHLASVVPCKVEHVSVTCFKLFDKQWISDITIFFKSAWSIMETINPFFINLIKSWLVVEKPVSKNPEAICLGFSDFWIGNDSNWHYHTRLVKLWFPFFSINFWRRITPHSCQMYQNTLQFDILSYYFGY